MSRKNKRNLLQRTTGSSISSKVRKIFESKLNFPTGNDLFLFHISWFIQRKCSILWIKLFVSDLIKESKTEITDEFGCFSFLPFFFFLFLIWRRVSKNASSSQLFSSCYVKFSKLTLREPIVIFFTYSTSETYHNYVHCFVNAYFVALTKKKIKKQKKDWFFESPETNRFHFKTRTFSCSNPLSISQVQYKRKIDP